MAAICYEELFDVRSLYLPRATNIRKTCLICNEKIALRSGHITYIMQEAFRHSNTQLRHSNTTLNKTLEYINIISYIENKFMIKSWVILLFNWQFNSLFSLCTARRYFFTWVQVLQISRRMIISFSQNNWNFKI